MGARPIQKELFQYDDMIKNFYFSNYKKFSHPALCLDLDDILQEMRLCVIQATPKYDASKGTTLKTYLYMHLTDRLKDIKAKIQRRMQTNAGFIDDITLNSNIENETVENKIDYINYKSYQDNYSQQESAADLVDVKIIIENLRPDDRELFIDKNIKGHSFSEMSQIHDKSITYLCKKVRKINKIFDTLRFQ